MRIRQALSALLAACVLIPTLEMRVFPEEIVREAKGGLALTQLRSWAGVSLPVPSVGKRAGLVPAVEGLAAGTARPQEAYDLFWFQAGSKAAATWGSLADPKSRTLRGYAAASSGELPAFDDRLVLNCYEYVLYTALRAPLLDRKELREVYRRKDGGEPLARLLAPSGTRKIGYRVVNGKVALDKGVRVEPFDVILMDGASHVVQATGRPRKDGGLEVVSFSPRPIWGDGSSEGNVPSLSPEVTTVESLIEQMVELYPDVPTDWQAIDLQAGRPFWLRE